MYVCILASSLFEPFLVDRKSFFIAHFAPQIKCHQNWLPEKKQSKKENSFIKSKCNLGFIIDSPVYTYLYVSIYSIEIAYL